MGAFLNLGFRPFFLLGAAWGVLEIIIWVAYQAGWVPALVFPDPVAWHAHEMVFGFSAAIIAGFVLTASQNWTGIPGISGMRLFILVLLWTVARILSLFLNDAPLLFAIVDLSFFPALAFFLVPYLWQKSQANNKIFFLLFFVLFLLNLSIHLGMNRVVNFATRPFVQASVYLIVFIVTLMGGRVIPFFTGVVIPEPKPVRLKWLDLSAQGSLGLFIFIGAIWEYSMPAVVLAFVVAALHLLRVMLWRPWRTLGVPVLLILHLAYAWVPLGFVLRGLASLQILPASIATHALTAGVISVMIYGMITRVSLGHTGRPIHVSAPIVFGYWLISLAAVIRVFGPLLAPVQSLYFIESSGALWIAAFGLFIVIYGPMLINPRADGRAG